MVKKTAVIVGLGGHARGSWMKSLAKHPDWELVALVDTDTELLENAYEITKRRVPMKNCFTKITELAENMDPLPDLAIIATPIYTHHVLVKETMKAGMHVICEKNMASTIYQGKQMVQLTLDHPELCTAMGTQRRYQIHTWSARKFFQEGECPIGKLNFIQWNDAFNWGDKMYRTGWRQWLQEIFAEDQMIHWFDLMRWVTGLDIVQIYADSFIPTGINWQGSSTVIANIALAKEEDFHHRHKWVWCRFYGDWKRMGPKDLNTGLKEFSGTKGRARITPGLMPGWGRLFKRKNKGLVSVIQTHLYEVEGRGSKWKKGGYPPQLDICNLGTKYMDQRIILEQMSRGIDSKGKNQPDNNFKDVFKSFAAVMGAIESSRTGKAIFVPDYWKHMGI